MQLPLRTGIEGPARLLALPRDAARARRTALWVAALVLALSDSGPAQVPVLDPSSPPGAPIPPSRDRVLYDEREGGEVWGRGATYKIGFGPAGTAFVPFLGSDAPCNHPVTFRVESATLAGQPLALDADAPARREGDFVRYERGGLTEAYELSMGAVEQTFVFETLPAGASGDLVVRLSVESDLEVRDGDGSIEFAGERGGVRYGHATALDAAGASAAAPTTRTAAGIEIRVPAEFVASARLPLVIDPFVSSFTLDSWPIEALLPDVAYDASTDRWLVVWVEAFSATDHDVAWYLTNPTSPFGASGYLDGSNDFWTDPACANHNGANQFLVVVESGLPTSSITAILGRTITIGTPTVTVGNGIIISPINFQRNQNPDVGGDWASSPSANYAVVYETASTTSNNIYGRLVTSSGSLVGTGPIAIDASAGTVDSLPSISKSNAGGAWNIVWERQVTTTSVHTYGARLAVGGALASSTFQISTTDARQPSASSYLSGTSKWLVSWRGGGSSAAGVGLASIDGSTVVESTTLAAVLNGFVPQANTFSLWSDVETDGSAFVLAYVWDDGQASLYFARMATISLLGSKLRASQDNGLGVGPAASWASGYQHASIASAHGSGGALRRHLAVYTDSNEETVGYYYDVDPFVSFCRPGHDVGACPCSNPPGAQGRGCNNSFITGGARLIGSGQASLANDSVLLTSDGLLPNGLLIFNQGSAVVPAIQFGQGLRCVGGATKRMYTSASQAGSAVAPPTAADPSLHERSAALGDPIAPGTSRYYYVYYRDPTVLGACPAGLTYNTTPSLQVIWAP